MDCYLSIDCSSTFQASILALWAILFLTSSSSTFFLSSIVLSYASFTISTFSSYSRTSFSHFLRTLAIRSSIYSSCNSISFILSLSMSLSFIYTHSYLYASSLMTSSFRSSSINSLLYFRLLCSYTFSFLPIWTAACITWWLPN